MNPSNAEVAPLAGGDGDCPRQKSQKGDRLGANPPTQGAMCLPQVDYEVNKLGQA